MTSIDSFMKDIESVLGTDLFCTQSKLTKIGLFGTAASCNEALKKGLFPSIRISEHRVLIPTKAVIEFVRENLIASKSDQV